MVFLENMRNLRIWGNLELRAYDSLDGSSEIVPSIGLWREAIYMSGGEGEKCDCREHEMSGILGKQTSQSQAGSVAASVESCA